MPTLAVTGSTGKVGGMVAARIATAGRRQRLVVRDASRAPDRPGDVAVADYLDRRAGTAALRGIRTLFMVSAAEKPDRVQDHLTFIDAAQEAGVEQLVYLSFFGAAPDATFTLGRDHWATEEHLRASGIDHVILRDNLYLDFLPGLVVTTGRSAVRPAPERWRPSPSAMSPRWRRTSCSTRSRTWERRIH